MKENKINLILLTVSVILSIITITMNNLVVDSMNWVVYMFNTLNIAFWGTLGICAIFVLFLPFVLIWWAAESIVEDKLIKLKINYHQISDEEYTFLVRLTLCSMIISIVGILVVGSFFFPNLYTNTNIQNKILLSVIFTLNFIILFNITRNVTKRVYDKILTRRGIVIKESTKCPLNNDTNTL